MKGRAEPASGHKCMGAKLSVRVTCECGWESPNYGGKGARAFAYAEWRAHVADVHKKAGTR